MANNDVQHLLDMLYEMIDGAKNAPLTSDKCILNRDEALDLLDEIRAQLPVELSRAQEIISAFEEKQQLTELVTQTLSREDNTGIQVYIGDETPVQTMRDCSVVTATYELGDGMKGTIGIIGPKRMDYEHVLKSMKRLQTELDQMFHKNDRKVE